MMKFIKVILCLLFAVVLYAAASEISAKEYADADAYATLPVQNKELQATITAVKFPYSPDAELAGAGMTAYQISLSRIQRINMLDYVFSVKSISQKLADRDAVLSQHQCRLYDSTTSYCCHPASEYYVFALRHIIV